MVPIQINQNFYDVKENISVLEACRFLGIKIPRFCYHETLSVAGNCRMCLIKLENDDKLIISCLTKITPFMEVVTEDPFIQKAREDVIEFLLLNHPLDCPICDQGGECDLQDQVKKYGSNHSKLFLNKTSVNDKIINPFIKTIMTRCIHCTRCVRYGAEISGVDLLGTLNRGHSTEIGTYTPIMFDSEISGNVIDLCPVGALTSKPYAFKFRPWELKSVESIDLSDGIGSNVYFNFSEGVVSRVQPKFNSKINENLISDKARFSYDKFLSSQILHYIFEISQGSVNKKIDLDFFISSIRSNLKNNVLFLVNDELNLENLNYLKNISIKNKNILLRNISLNNNFNKSNFFLNINNEKLSNIYSSLQNCFLFAVNPRTEGALINSRLRFLEFHYYYKIYSYGYKYNSNLKNIFINFDLSNIITFFEGKCNFLSKIVMAEASPLFIFGYSLNARNICYRKLSSFLSYLNPSSIFLRLDLYNNSAGASFLNIKSITKNDILKSKSYFFFNLEKTYFLNYYFFQKNLIDSTFYWFNFYNINNFVQNGYQIPINYFFENKKETYINLEYRPQNAFLFFFNKNEQINSFYLKIFFLLFNTNNDIKKKYLNFIEEIIASPESFDTLYSKKYLNLVNVSFLKNRIVFVDNLKNYPIKPQIIDFYQNNNFVRYSQTMLSASKEYQKHTNNFF